MIKLRRPIVSFALLLAAASAVPGCGANYPQSREYDAVAAMPPAATAVADAPQSGEAYKDYGQNPFVSAAEDRFSTFAIDVDTASYAVSRRKLTEGALPPKEAVRVEEFVNSFDYRYEAPTNKPFAVHLTAAPSPYTAGHHLLRVGLQSKRSAPSDRKAAHLVYLVDTSGSMQGEDRIGLVKESLRVLTKHLKAGDTVAICTYAGSTRELLAPTGIEDKAKILDAIEGLSTGGGTAMSSGFDTAYALASKTLKKGEINRVIVLSDGDANLGPSSHEEILKRIEGYKEQGITLSTVGFGNGNYKDTMMEQLADKGDGNYTYIDSLDQAQKSFAQNLDSMLEVVARDVKVQVEFDPAVVKRYRLVGYENRDVADKDFRNDKVDGGEVGAGHSVTALYDLELAEGAKGKSLVSVNVRFKPPVGGGAEELKFAMEPSSLLSDFADAPKNFRLAAAVMGFADTLRQSPEASGLDIALAVANKASSESKDEIELMALIQRAIDLGGKRTPVAVAK